jgi:hypothetical protein
MDRISGSTSKVSQRESAWPEAQTSINKSPPICTTFEEIYFCAYFSTWMRAGEVNIEFLAR